MPDEPQQSFFNVYPHKVDGKKRVAIPADWRLSGEGSVRMLQSNRENEPIVKVLTPQKFAEYEDKIREVGRTYAEQETLIGRLHSHSHAADVNSQGKLLIPQKYLDHIGAADSVLLVGRGGYFEIWEQEKFNRADNLERMRLDSLNESLGIF